MSHLGNNLPCDPLWRILNPTQMSTRTASVRKQRMSSQCSALTFACCMSRASAMKSSGSISSEGLGEIATFHRKCFVWMSVARPILQELRTNICTKLRPLFKETWSFTGVPCVKKAHHSAWASLGPSTFASSHSPLVSMNGPHSTPGLSQLCLLPPPALAHCPAVSYIYNVFLLTLGFSSQPTDMLWFILIRDDIFPFLLQIHPTFLLFKFFKWTSLGS